MGYARVKNNIHSVVHRFVVEKFGYKLEKENVVHHINGDKKDNRIENLLICKDRKEHNNIHAGKNCPKGHIFTLDNTLYHKNKNGKPSRRCRECHRLTGNIKK